MSYGNPQGKTVSDFSGTSHTTFSLTFSAAVGPGNSVVGAVGYAGTLTSLNDDKSNTYTLVNTLTTGGGFKTTTFYAIGLTNGPTTLTANFSGGGASYTLLSGDEFSGIASFDAQAGQTQTNPSGTNSVSSGSATTNGNGDLVYGFVFPTSIGAASTHGTGFAYTAAQASDTNHYPEFLTQASAGAVAATANPSGNDTWNTLMIAFKPAASGSLAQQVSAQTVTGSAIPSFTEWVSTGASPGALAALPISWLAGSDPAAGTGPVTVLVAPRAMTIVGLQMVPDVANGAAATVSVTKNGTAVHSGSFNANGTAGTVQTLTPTTTALAAGDKLGLSTTGTFSASVGNVTILLA